MNERILELAKEAGHRYVPSSNTGPLRVEYLTPELEKFAELIVQECARVSEDDITDGDACCTNTAARIARQIKKHFGVEK